MQPNSDSYRLIQAQREREGKIEREREREGAEVLGTTLIRFGLVHTEQGNNFSS